MTAVILVVAAVATGSGVAVHQARVARHRFDQVRKLANKILFDVDGEIANLNGGLKAREIIVATALEYLNSLAGESSSDPGLQWELAVAYAKVADVQGSTGSPSLRRPQDGFVSYAKALALALPLDDRRLLTPEQREQLVQILCTAAAMHRYERNLVEARKLDQETGSGSREAQRGFVLRYAPPCLGGGALTLRIAGDLAGSLNALEQQLTLARENQQLASAKERILFGSLLYNVAVGRLKVARLAGAQAIDSEAMAHFRTLAAERPNDVQVKRFLHQTMVQMANLEGAPDFPSFGRFPGAVRRYEEAIAVLEPVFDANPGDRSTEVDVGLIYVRAAASALEVDARKAKDLASRAIQLFDEGCPDDHSTRAQPPTVLARAHVAMGDLASAERVVVATDALEKAPLKDSMLQIAWAQLERARGRRDEALQRARQAIEDDEADYESMSTPVNAFGLSLSLEMASRVAPGSSAFRQRMVELWKDQDRRYPGTAYIQGRLAEAVKSLESK